MQQQSWKLWIAGFRYTFQKIISKGEDSTAFCLELIWRLFTIRTRLWNKGIRLYIHYCIYELMLYFSRELYLHRGEFPFCQPTWIAMPTCNSLVSLPFIYLNGQSFDHSSFYSQTLPERPILLPWFEGRVLI